MDELLRPFLPNVLQHRSAARDKHPMIHVVFHQPMRHSNGEGGSPPECLLNDGRDVREVVDIGMVWQSFTTENTVELALGRSHDFRVPGHREEKATEGSVGLAGGEYDRGAGAVVIHTVSDIPVRDGQKEGNGRWEDATYRYTQHLQCCK